jgi:hypothetical protein
VGINDRASHDWFHQNFHFRGLGLGMELFHAPRQKSPDLDLPTSGLRSAGFV